MTHNEYKKSLNKPFRLMTEDELRHYYNLRYKSHTPEQRTAHRKRANNFYKDNKLFCRASSHTAQVRRNYPSALANSDVSTSLRLMKWIELNSNATCPYCGDAADSIDHVIPLSKDGKHHTSNLRMICLSCNIMKSDHTEEEFLTQVKRISAKCNL